MNRITLLRSLIIAGLLSLVALGPAAAAATGTLCGQVTAFTAPTAVADGSITIDGRTEVIDSSALAAIDATTLVALNALATADATTCLAIQAATDGTIVDIAIAASAELCGTVAANAALDTYSVAGVLVPASVVNADADLEALLAAAAAGNAALCADLTLDTTTGLVVGATVSGTLNLCGTATLDATGATVDGVTVPLTLLDAEARAALALAIDAGADVCISVRISDTSLVQANVTADVTVCGRVTLDASGNAVVNGVILSDALLGASAEALLDLAAAANGVACAAVDVTSNGGDATIRVTVDVELCATVAAVTDDSITVGGITILVAGGTTAGIEVGDRVCVEAGAGPGTGSNPPTGTLIGQADGDPTSGRPGGSTTISDTATRDAGFPLAQLGGVLVLLAVASGLRGAAVVARSD